MMSPRQAMEHLMDDARVRAWGIAGNDGSPPLELYESGDDLVLTAALRDLKREDVHVTIQGDMLRIEGETRREDVKDEHFHRRERHFGRFFREVALPMMVKADAVLARFEDGILTLRLPEAEIRARRMEITGGQSRAA